MQLIFDKDATKRTLEKLQIFLMLANLIEQKITLYTALTSQ